MIDSYEVSSVRLRPAELLKVGAVVFASVGPVTAQKESLVKDNPLGIDQRFVSPAFTRSIISGTVVPTVMDVSVIVSLRYTLSDDPLTQVI
tara:strand:+ start:1423 stop:1695 length:273 start_codon:yes stop_codon:yes gene_type:complete